MRNGFYLPEYKLTPQAIFQDEILAFDVNFFNPKENKKTQGETKTKEVVDKDSIVQGAKAVEEYIANLDKEDLKGNKNYYEESEKLLSQGIPSKGLWSEIFENMKTEEEFKAVLFANGKGYNETLALYINGLLQFYKSMNTEEKAEFKELINKISGVFVEVSGSGEAITSVNKIDEAGLGVPKKTITYTEEKEERSSAGELQAVVSAWYTTFRNIALVALLSVLVYIGIRITLSSVASDKAKYKQMLGDWVVALCLVFLMHYIMSFAVTLNSKIIHAISSITTSSIGSEKDVLGNGEKEYNETTNSVEDGEDVQEVSGRTGIGVQLFVIEDKDAVDRAYETLVGDTDDQKNKSGKYSPYYKNFSTDKSKLFWMTTDYMAQARMLGQDRGEDADKNESQTSVTRAGYNIIYVVLVIYTVIFCFTYLKRVIYMAFLTIIAPLVAITYPIDKVNDGKAQAFDMWLKEYIFNLVIQPMHLSLYTILVGSAMRFASQNIFYVVVALGFLIPAEKLLRRFFGFEKAQTPGMFAGAAGSALMMSGLNKLMHPKPPKGGLGPGGGNSKDGEEEETKTPPWRDKEFDATDNLIGIGGNDTQNNQNNTNVSEFRDNLTEEEQQGLNFAQTGRQEALDAMNTARTEDERREYQDLLNSYENDLNGYRNPDFIRMNNSNTSNNTNNTLSDRIRASSPGQRKRRKSLKRAVSRGARNYFTGPNGLGKKMQAKHKANGGFVRRGARMAAGVAAAGTLAAAGGIIGITSGDPSKAAQYMAAGAAGGYALGKGAANSAADTLKVQGTLKEAKKGYYGDDYKEHQQQKYKKDFMRNEENLRRIEDKLKVERKEAKKIMKENMGYYLDHEIYDMDDAIATYRLEKEGNMSRDQAVATAQYATQVLNGEDTRYMTSKKKNEYRNTFIPKFTQQGSRNPEADVDKVFDNVDKFHKFKK